MRMKRLRLASVSVLALIAGMSATAAAQDEGASPPGAAEDTGEEVIVTGTRRAAKLQDVPIAITTFNAEALKTLGVSEMRDVSAPNFVFPEMYTTSRSYISSRGVFQEVNSIGTDSGFSVFVDGVYMGRNMAFSVDSTDIARVEILRGPQGTLWGKNTISGAMSIATTAPSQEFEGHVEATYGNLELTRIRSTLNVPIVKDLLAMRVSFQSARRDGYVKNLVGTYEDGGGIHLDSVRGQLLFTPSDNFSLRFTADYLDSRNVGYTWEDETPGLGLGDTIPHTNSSDTVPQEARRDGGASLTGEYVLPSGHTITSITAYRESRTRWLEDEDGSPANLYASDNRDEQEFWSQELRLNSPSGERFDYVLGLYYFDQTARSDYRIPFGPAAGGPFTVRYNNFVDTTSFAAFAHANYHVTDALNFFAGIRYTDEDKDFVGSRIVAAGIFESPEFILPPVTLPPNQPFKASVSASEISWTAGVQYRFSDNIMAYANVADGFKSGGFQTTNGAVVKPEYLTSYEIGLKTTLLNGAATLNIAAFYSDYTDLQVRDLVLGPPITTVFRNAASVVAKGFEVEFSARPTDNLRLNLGLGYVDSTFKSFNTRDVLGTPIDAAGNHVPMTPPWTVNLGFDYEIPLAQGFVRLHADYTWLDDHYGILDAGQNGANFKIDAYGLVNARVGYVSEEGGWSLFLWSKNLTDEITPVDRRLLPTGFPPPAGPGTVQFATYSEPRTFGVTLEVDF